MEKERTTILLDKDVMLELKRLSKTTNKSTSFLIREAVNSYVTKKAPKKEIGIIGIASSSEYSDIANKKDEYLKGFGED
ncbi:MAG: ribbon-helix-helix domain-containing protein [Actinobacteria bacterium]|nr:ribbon-helix-helix domain-containing protein [Actinomycetota bacterium]MCG2790348.1 ribbon-helix-helix domain-containing protein [Actinomycetes bacterium]